ncbi:MAG: hypothetical protein IJX98_00960 [Clostridia bacterium]|nr:hypothetical protein [Clostridia bacterium]
MAKKTKKTSSGSSKGGMIRACTYFAVIIAAFLFLFGGLFPKIGSILNLIGQICLVIGIAFPAYDFTRGKSIVWRVIYWIALAVYVCGCVLGVI